MGDLALHASPTANTILDDSGSIQSSHEAVTPAQQYAVLVIPAACRHIVDVQLTDNAAHNAERVRVAQVYPCRPCNERGRF